MHLDTASSRWGGGAPSTVPPSSCGNRALGLSALCPPSRPPVPSYYRPRVEGIGKRMQVGHRVLSYDLPVIGEKGGLNTTENGATPLFDCLFRYTQVIVNGALRSYSTPFA